MVCIKYVPVVAVLCNVTASFVSAWYVRVRVWVKVKSSSCKMRNVECSG